ncbi:MAG: prolipoprotein diacylglyceryl transferase [Cellulomonadaceae bacterium]|jgi:prolipoprotein diacylglyceryl transferase|nr:prolipoprotein diacylglyceryl transferase [Cellulomonadaceae bacterium]
MKGFTVLPASIPSPPVSEFHLGPLTIHIYALAIIAGIAAAVWIGTRRFMERTEGGGNEDVLDIAFWAVPFGILGARLYHVITTPGPYFGAGGNPIRVLYIWEGGLGIWGGIAFGALGAWIACRRKGVRWPVFLDAIAPGLLVAQAIGRIGNYFNQELFGRDTTLPWGLQIDPSRLPPEVIDGTLFHPTFLYELLWNLAMAAVLIWVDRKLRLGHGRVFALYMALYCAGRVWIETLRVDNAVYVLGLRLNVWTALVVGIAGLVLFIALGKRYPERELDARIAVPDALRDVPEPQPV